MERTELPMEVIQYIVERACWLIRERRPADCDALLNEFPALKAELFAFEPEE